MFSFVEQTSRFDAAKRIATFLVSIVAHLAAILILVLLPLIFIAAAPEVVLLSFLIAAPAPPPGPAPPTPPIPHDRFVAARAVTVAGFVPPITIPDGIAPPAPEPVPGDLPTGAIVGIPGGNVAGNSSGISGSPLGSITFENGTPAPPPPPPPKPRVKDPVRRGGDVQESKLIRKVEPTYPWLAIQARVTGVVVLDVRVDEEGNVESIRVLKGHPLLNEAVVNAVRQWKYSPTILNGEPVPVIATVTVNFILR